MYYNDFLGNKVSALGFGTMRLPLIAGGTATDIDEAQVEQMTEYAIRNGVNYFDTAWPYHGGCSELVMGRVLSKYPRDSYFLADKFPGHQVMDVYDPEGIFTQQLKKCKVEYFDYYLLHNVCEFSIGVYEDEKWGIMDYFRRMKAEGKIRHLGFSSHAAADLLEEFVDKYGEDMEFCQIQLNYMDWDLQEAGRKYDILTSHNIPIIVMEPLRGGKLADLAPVYVDRIHGVRADETAASMAFKYLQSLPNVKVVLSGMSDQLQMEQNVATFGKRDVLKEDEKQVLYDIADSMKNAVPCTGCRYCCDGCPKGLDIPELIKIYNDLCYQVSFTPCMMMDTVPDDKKPEACIGCGACKKVCPQKIDIPEVMKDFSKRLENGLDWTKICKEREEAARRLAKAAQS